MKTKKIISALLLTTFLTSCGKTNVKYNEPTLDSYKETINYEDFSRKSDQLFKEFKILSDEYFSDSFVSTINIGNKKETSLLRGEKEYKNINETTLRYVDAKYDNGTKAALIDVTSQEKCETIEIGDDNEDIISNSSTKSSMTRKIQDELKDSKTITYVIDDKNKSYELAGEVDETTAYKYCASMCVLLIVLSGNNDINYSPSLSDEEKAKFKFYSDNDVLTQDYNDNVTDKELSIDSTTIGTYDSNISFVTQYKISENALKYITLYKETTVNKYTVDYESDYLSGDKETVVKTSYMVGEIKLSKTSVSKSDITGYKLLK